MPSGGPYGVGDITGAQLMAEIGDIRRFADCGARIAFAGVDPGVNEPGKYSSRRVRTTIRGPPHLRRTLFRIVSTHIRIPPPDEPVCQFLDRKRDECPHGCLGPREDDIGVMLTDEIDELGRVNAGDIVVRGKRQLFCGYVPHILSKNQNKSECVPVGSVFT